MPRRFPAADPMRPAAGRGASDGRRVVSVSDPISSLPPPPRAPGGVAPGDAEASGAAVTAAPGPSDGPADAAPPPVALLDPPPRPGELTLAWRVGTAVTWVAVVLAFAAVWNASVQLGLSTWWLGPRGDPRPRVVQLVPFVAPTLMVLGTINNLRWLGWYGLAAAGGLAAIGLGDLGRVASIAATELAIAGAAGAISLASLTGTYRAPAEPSDPPTPR